LFFRTVEVEVSVWSFVVMGVSIIIDVSRSRALYRVARKTGSQALGGRPALLDRRLVVLGSHCQPGHGSIGPPDQPWLMSRYRCAGCSGIVVFVSLQLGKRTVRLLDSARGRDRLMGCSSGVVGSEAASARVVGSFADLTLAVGPGTSQARSRWPSAGAAVGGLSLRDVVVPGPTDDARDSVVGWRRVAARLGLGHTASDFWTSPAPHNGTTPGSSDHTRWKRPRERVASRQPSFRLCRISRSPRTGESRMSTLGGQRLRIGTRCSRLCTVLDLAPACHVHQVEVHGSDGALALSFQCDLPGDVSIADAHDLTERIERALRAEAPALTRVVIRVRPRWETAGLAA
jgi:hypothetical protein